MPAAPHDMFDAIIRNLPARTGHSIEEWIEIVRASGVVGANDRRNWLRETHRLGQNTVWSIVALTEEADGVVPPSDDQMLADQYAGAKAALQPIYERLLAVATGLGKDVSVGVRKTYVTFGRRRQFAVVQPSTKVRLDLGLRLDHVEFSGRLQPAGSFASANITHRVALTALDDVDADVEGWLAAAYAGAKS